MKNQLLSILTVTLLLCSGCAVKGSYIETRGELDKSLYYYELDTSNQKRVLSEDPEAAQLTGKPTRVPHPALVDLDSLIHIRVAREKGLLLTSSQGLLEQKQKVSSALLELEKVIDARQRAIEAYQDPDLDKFRALQEAAEDVESKFLNRLTEDPDTRKKGLWPEGTPEYDLLSDPDPEVGVYDPPRFTKLQIFLQQKVDAIEAGDRAIAKEVRDRQVSLRLEAFLSSPDPEKDPIPIHLDGYDSIRQGEFQRRDRLGLDLSEEERAQLQAQVKATNEAADVAERVRKKEISLSDAVWESVPRMSSKLGKLILEIETLLPQLKTKTLMQRLKKTKKVLDEFLDEVKRQESTLANSFKNELKQMPQELQSSVREDLNLEHVVNVLKSLAKAKTLHRSWLVARRDDTIPLINESLFFLSDLERTVEDLTILAEEEFNDFSPDIETILSRFFEEKFKGLTRQAKKTLLQVATGPQGQALKEDVESYYRDLRRMLDISRRVVQALKVFGGSVAVGTRAPESLKVPLEQVKDTFIDLNYTPRLVGDTVTLRATLYKGDKEEGEEELDTTTASFRVSRFGYFAKLSPAVVLVKPTKLKGGSDDFRFSPILSWMHHYAPRPEAEGAWMQTLRALKPGIGIHSAFLHFDGDDSDSVQFGLGGTFSIWENRLQFGGGVNLMADSDDDGLIYYFIGTDLIGLLQTLQTTTGIGR